MMNSSEVDEHEDGELLEDGEIADDEDYNDAIAHAPMPQQREQQQTVAKNEKENKEST